VNVETLALTIDQDTETTHKLLLKTNTFKENTRKSIKSIFRNVFRSEI